MKGLVHDAAVNLMSKEPGFRTLEVDPSFDQINNFLQQSIKGGSSSSPEMKSRINNLRKKYGLSGSQILGYTFGSGESVGSILETLAEKRCQNWEEETQDYQEIQAEERVRNHSLSGRMDLFIQKEGSDEIKEIKIGDGGEYQVSAYWLMLGREDVDTVIENPVEGNQRYIDPREKASEIYWEKEEFRDLVDEFLRYQKSKVQDYDSERRAALDALSELELPI